MSLRALVDWLRIPRRVEAQVPLARALVDHARTGRSRALRVTRSGDLQYDLDTSAFFELEGEQSVIDDALLGACVGRVLDVGAGAGRHTLALEARGHDVCAIDVSSDCVGLMQERGVRDARHVDVWSLLDEAHGPDLGAFDTLLFGMQTIGLTGRVDALVALLRGLQQRPGLLRRGGRIVLDSSAPTGPGFDQRVECAVPADPSAPIEDAALAGETRVSFGYRGARGAPFEWIYVGAEALVALGHEAGLETRILARLGESPEYAACLTRPGDAISERSGV